jgi:hypothetical protein
MDIVKIDQYSSSVASLRLGYKNKETNSDVVCWNASGFMYEFNNVSYLITNWHVLSGRDPKSGQTKDKVGAVPEFMLVEAHCVTGDGEISKLEARVDLYLNDGSPIWVQHRVGQSYDIAAIKTIAPVGAKSVTINTLPCYENMRINIGSDVFILGFPFWENKTEHLPIWKRGSIASEYEYYVDNKPCFLIDTATREGMSGSPVIMRPSGRFQDEEGNSVIAAGLPTKLLGVYSGRYGAEDLEKIQLGIVWRRVLIDEMLANPVLGSYQIT